MSYMECEREVEGKGAKHGRQVSGEAWGAPSPVGGRYNGMTSIYPPPPKIPEKFSERANPGQDHQLAS